MRFFLAVSIFVWAGSSFAFGFQESKSQLKSYSEPEVRWYKGNLHTHSLWSDGDDFPEMIAKWYFDHGYQFLTLTDHNILSEGEKWMTEKEVLRRGGDTILAKCIEAFGEDWVEKKENDSGDLIRLKGLAEFRQKFEADERFLMMTGEEISDSVDGFPIHMNATNLARTLLPAGGKTVREAMRNNLRSAQEQAEKENRPIIVHLNHPNFGWAVTAEDLAFVTMEKFFEVYNGHPAINHRGDDIHASVERVWDIANTIRISQLKERPIIGLGTDDCHNYFGKQGGSHPGRGWIMVRANELSPAALIAAINAGDFYASSGVTLNEVEFDNDAKTLGLAIEPKEGETFTTKFIGTRKGFDQTSTPYYDSDGKAIRVTRNYSTEVGMVLAEVKGLNPSYQFEGNELYVRAVVTSSADHPNPSFEGQKKQAWTQPVGWK